MSECYQCHGKKIIELLSTVETCEICDGRGVLPDPEPPAPISINQSITLSDGGGDVQITAGAGGGTSANNSYTIHAINSETFTLSGHLFTVSDGSLYLKAQSEESAASEELLCWAVKEMQNLRADGGGESLLQDPVSDGSPVASLSLRTFADALGVLEHHGKEGVFFLISSRDFAEVRMFEENSRVLWKGDKLFVFNLEVKKDPRVPLGDGAAVSCDRKMAAFRTR